MFESYVSPESVAKANTVNYSGATDALQFYAQLADKRRKEAALQARQDASEKLDAASALKQLAAKRAVGASPATPALNQFVQNGMKEVSGLVQTNPLQAKMRASELAAQYQGMSDWNTNMLKQVDEEADNAVKQNPLLDRNLVKQHLIDQTYRTKDGGVNWDASAPSWGGVNIQDPNAAYQFRSNAAVEKALPETISKAFTPVTETIYNDEQTGQPFRNQLGDYIGKDVTRPSYMAYGGGNFFHKYDPIGIQGDKIADVVTPQQLQGLTTGMSKNATPQGQMNEELGQMPALPNDYFGPLAATQAGHFAIAHKMEDIIAHPQQYFGKDGDKIVKIADPEALARYAGLQVLKAYGPKGGTKVSDNMDIPKEVRQRNNDAFSQRMQQANYGLSVANYNRQVTKDAKSDAKDDDAYSGVTINTGMTGKDGKPIGKPLKNKDLKALTESEPYSWFNIMGGGGPQAQAEAIKTKPRVNVNGQPYIDLTPSSQKDGSYFNDPHTQQPVRVLFSPVAASSNDPVANAAFKKMGMPAGNLLIVPMTKDKAGVYSPDYTKAQSIAPNQYSYFFHTYAPQVMKGGGSAYDAALAHLVNQAFGISKAQQ